MTISFKEFVVEDVGFLIERGKEEVDNLNDAKGKLFELLVGGHLKHGSDKNGMPKGMATHFRKAGEEPEVIHSKLKSYLDANHPGAYDEISRHSLDAANHIRQELAARGHHQIDDVAWTSQKNDHEAFTGDKDENATADIMVKSRDKNGNTNKPIGISLKYGTEKDPNLKNPGLESMEGLGKLKSKALDSIRQGHYDVLRSLGFGDKVGGKEARAKYDQLAAKNSKIVKQSDAHALETQKNIAGTFAKGLSAAAKKDPSHLHEVVKKLLFPPTMYSTLRHHTHVGPQGAAFHHTNDTEDEATRTANAFEEYRVRPHSGGVTAVIEGRKKGSDKFEPAVNLSLKTTRSYSGQGFNAIVKAPFLRKLAHEEPPVTGPVSSSKPDMSKSPETSPEELASHAGFHRVKNLLSQYRTTVPSTERRVPQTGSPFQSMSSPGVKRPEPSRKLSPEGVPEHMHQAHRDTESYMGFKQ